MDAQTEIGRPDGAHAQGNAADRVGRTAAAVHGVDRQHDPGKRAADHRARPRQHDRVAMADHDLSVGRHCRDAALRQDRRHPRPPLRPVYRDRSLHGRLAGLRAGAFDDDPDLRPRLAGARRFRAVIGRHHRARRRGRAEGARALLRVFLDDLHHRRRDRTGARRLDRGAFALVGDFLAQHPAWPGGALDHHHGPAPAAAARAAAPPRRAGRRS